MIKFKISSLITICLIICNALIAQTPDAFRYQTIVRDGSGGIIANQLVSFRIGIIAGNIAGIPDYIETHSLATSEYGLANFNIGDGIVSMGNFTTLDWGGNSHFIQVEVDITGLGSNFQLLGTSELLAVPYALHAKTAEFVDDADADAQNEIQSISSLGNQIILNLGGGTIISDNDTSNEIQVISKIGNVVTLSSGGGTFIDDIDDADNDPNNEIQSLSMLNSTTLQISGGNSITLSQGLADLDADTINELQVLSISNDTIFISLGNYIVLPLESIDGDTSSTNEHQSLILSGDSLSLSDGNTVIVPSSYQNLNLIGDTLSIDSGNFVLLPIDFDPDSTNELQTLSISNDTLYLTSGNYVLLPPDGDSDDSNEIQTLSFQNDSILLTGSVGLSLTELLNNHNGAGNGGTLDQFDQNINDLVYLGYSSSTSGIKHLENVDQLSDNDSSFFVLINAQTDVTLSDSTFLSGAHSSILNVDTMGTIVWSFSFMGNNELYSLHKFGGFTYIHGRAKANNIIQGITINGNHFFTLRLTSSGQYDTIVEYTATQYIDYLEHIALDSIGNIYMITDVNTGAFTITKYDYNFNYINSTSIGSYPYSPLPHDIEVMRNGDILVSHQYGMALIDNFLVKKWEYSLAGEAQITEDQGGFVYAGHSSSGRIYKMNLSSPGTPYWSSLGAGGSVLKDIEPLGQDIFSVRTGVLDTLLYDSYIMQGSYPSKGQVFKNNGNAPHHVIDVRSLDIPYVGLTGYNLTAINNKMYMTFEIDKDFYNNGIYMKRGLYIGRMY